MPILDYENEVMGVAQIINKMEGGTEFSDKDEEVSFSNVQNPIQSVVGLLKFEVRYLC